MEAAPEKLVPSTRSNLWERFGGWIFIGICLFLITAWISIFPKASNNPLEFSLDALCTYVGITWASIVLWGILSCLFHPSFRPLKFGKLLLISGFVILVLAIVMTWNLVALYAFEGLAVVKVSGWDFTSRPFFHLILQVFTRLIFFRLLYYSLAQRA